MSKPCLEITYRQGKPSAAYLYLVCHHHRSWRGRPDVSEVPQPRLHLVMGHHVVSGDHSLFSEKNDPPMESGPAFEQALAQPSDAQPRMQVGESKPVSKRTKRLRNLISVGNAQFPNALPKARVNVDSHNLPVKGLVRPEILAALTSALTA